MVHSSRYKRGNAVLDTFVIVAIVLIGIFTMMLANVFVKGVNDAVQVDDTISAGAKADMAARTTQFPTLMDYAILFVFVIFWIGAVALAFMVPSHPAFIVFTLLLLVVMIFVAAAISNIYAAFAQDTDLAGETEFPITTFMFQHLPVYFIVVTLSVCAVLFGKPGSVNA